MELTARKDAPVELTWDLSAIYETEAAMEQDVERMKAMTVRPCESQAGRHRFFPPLKEMGSRKPLRDK